MPKYTLKDLRDRRAISQQQLASALDVSISTITSIETGRHEPRLSVARKIAAYFGVGMDDVAWPERPLRDQTAE